MSEQEYPNSEHRDNKLSFLEHLEALRWLLMRIVIVVLVFSIVVFIYTDWIFDQIIFAPLHTDFWTYQKMCESTHQLNLWFPRVFEATGGCFKELSLTVIAPKMTTQFMTAMLVAIIGGGIFSFPYIIWEIWRFIKPGLYNKEQNRARGLVLWTSILFLLGIVFGYYFVAPFSIHFLGSFEISSQVQNMPSLTSYMGTLTSTTLASGLMFELPVLVYFLSKIGLLTPEFMRKYRRHAVVVTLLVAAIITPPDVFSQIIITIPILILYEVSIFLSHFVVKRKKAAENQ